MVSILKILGGIVIGLLVFDLAAENMGVLFVVLFFGLVFVFFYSLIKWILDYFANIDLWKGPGQRSYAYETRTYHNFHTLLVNNTYTPDKAYTFKTKAVKRGKRGSRNKRAKENNQEYKQEYRQVYSLHNRQEYRQEQEYRQSKRTETGEESAEKLLLLLKKIIEIDEKIDEAIRSEALSKNDDSLKNDVSLKNNDSLKNDDSLGSIFKEELKIDDSLEIASPPKNPKYPCQYPMSLLYALKQLPERRIGESHSKLEDMTTLDIHVVTSKPVFDEHWQLLLHLLPKLTEINLVFIMQGTPFMQPLSLKTISKLGMFRNYEYSIARVDQVMKYFIKQMHYHMYFSSDEYTEPDVVVVFNNSNEMSEYEKEDIHSDISYSNMIHNYKTVLVLMDATQELVRQGVGIVDATRPIEQLVPPQVNPQRGFSPKHIIEIAESDTYYFTCLRRL